MNIRLLSRPALALAAVVAAVLASAPSAQAAPVVPTGHFAGGTRVGIGFGVGFPIGGHRSHAVPTGYWTYRQVPVTTPVVIEVQVPYEVAVQVPDRVVGRDVNGNPIWSYRTELRTQYRMETRTEYRTTYVTERVWVDTGPVVHHYPRGYGHVGVGFRIR